MIHPVDRFAVAPGLRVFVLSVTPESETRELRARDFTSKTRRGLLLINAQTGHVVSFVR